MYDRKGLMKVKDVFVVNFGGPETKADVHDFLKELFSDTFGIRFGLPAPLQRFIAKKIAKKRTPSIQEKYDEIGGGSPLVPLTKLLLNHLTTLMPDVNFHMGMRYTPPYLGDAILDIYRQGIREVVIFPLFPHFSYATTGSAIYEITRALNLAGLGPRDMKLRMICCWHVEPEYIEYSANLIKESMPEESSNPVLVISAHGIPVKYVDDGDPYQGQIVECAQAIIEKMGYKGDWELCYQSRVGPLEWLGPDVEEILEKYKGKGRPLHVFPISFVSDHIETMHEIDIEYGEIAQEYAIPWSRVPAPNDDLEFAKVIQAIIERRSQSRACELQGCRAVAKSSLGRYR